MRALKKLLEETKGALRAPTTKQKEAYGRLSHTFCAASMIGAITVSFTDKEAAQIVLAKVSALFFWGVLLFWTGALLSKGE